MSTQEVLEGFSVYEVGYHIVPTVAEENLAAEDEKIKEIIFKHKGVFVSEDFPKMRQLAYTMIKPIGGARQRFNTAYFGWIKFQATPEAVLKIKSELDATENVLRFLIVKTVLENTIYQKPLVSPKAEDDKKPGEEPKAPISEEELDKTIDELVVE